MNEREFYVHGPTCPQWEQPTSLAGWEAVELVVRETEAGSTEGVCPACGERVWFFIDGGTVDLMGYVRGSDEEIDGFLETLEPIAGDQSR